MKKNGMASGAAKAPSVSLIAHGLVHRVHAELTLNIPELEIFAGEMLGILGPNGAGKTTLLNLLTGTLRPVHGEIVLGNRSVHAMGATDLAAKRTVVRAGFESAGSGLTAREVIELGSLCNSMPAGMLHSLCHELSAAFDISQLLDTDFSVLSSGEKKRVEMARALVQLHGRENGHVLFLDEPFAHLDSRHARAVSNELVTLKNKGVAIVCVLHDINFAAQNCNRIIFIRDAKIVGQVAANEVYQPSLLAQIYDTPFAILRSGRSRYVVAKN